MSRDTVLELELVDDYLAGNLDEARQAELERTLRAEPGARRQFWIAINHEVLLRKNAFAGSTAEVAPVVIRPPTDWWRTASLRWASAALLLIAVGGLALVVRFSGDGPVAEIAGVNASDKPGVLRHANQGTVTLRNGLPVSPGDRIELTTGTTLDLRWRGEVTRIALSGGATLAIAAESTGMRLRLERGTLVAEVAPQASGRSFVVHTTQAAVTVVGTRFAVSTDAERTSVDVEQGRVRVADHSTGANVEVGAGGTAVAESGKAVALAEPRAWRWADRRPLGLMMLCAAQQGWPTNPRGWFNDPALDITSVAGLAAFQRRLDALIDQTIINLREMDAQGVVFWDIEGRELPIGYVGDPRQLGRLAPEMDAVADRMFARLRAAGVKVGVALRSQELVAGRAQRVTDPAGLLQAKIAYARKRWGATLFPILGSVGDRSGEMSMATLCRRVVAAHPDVLLMPTGDDVDVYRWSGVWQDAATPSHPDPIAARSALPAAFGVLKVLEPPELEQRHDELVRQVAAGDILTFRAWYRDPGLEPVKRIQAEAHKP